MLKGWPIFLLITAALWGGIAGLSESQQLTQDPQTEQAMIEARQISTELADQVPGLLLKEIEKGGLAGAVKVCSGWLGIHHWIIIAIIWAVMILMLMAPEKKGK